MLREREREDAAYKRTMVMYKSMYLLWTPGTVIMFACFRLGITILEAHMYANRTA